MIRFEEFLQGIHAEDYEGTDDDMEDSFYFWLGGMDVDEVREYGEAYGKMIIKKLTK